jgi:hypothetical protein
MGRGEMWEVELDVEMILLARERATNSPKGS